MHIHTQLGRQVGASWRPSVCLSVAVSELQPFRSFQAAGPNAKGGRAGSAPSRPQSLDTHAELLGGKDMGRAEVTYHRGCSLGACVYMCAHEWASLYCQQQTHAHAWS